MITWEPNNTAEPNQTEAAYQEWISVAEKLRKAERRCEELNREYLRIWDEIGYGKDYDDCKQEYLDATDDRLKLQAQYDKIGAQPRPLMEGK